MARNPDIYPEDFPSETPGVGRGPSAIEVQVKTLATQARESALKQAHSRRSLGQAAIDNQNSRLLVLGSLMPIYVELFAAQSAARRNETRFYMFAPYIRRYKRYYDHVEKLDSASDTLSRTGFTTSQISSESASSDEFSYLPYRWNMERLQFNSETIAQLGFYLSSRRYRVAASENSSTGIFYSGYRRHRVVDELSFPTESLFRIGYKVWSGHGAIAAGTREKAYILKGMYYYRYNRNYVYRHNYTTRTRTYLGRYGSGGHYFNAINSASYLYIGRGEYKRWWWTRYHSPIIERWDYENESLSNLGSTMTTRRSGAASGQAMARGWFAGGRGNGYLETIDQFTFDGETCQLYGQAFSEEQAFFNSESSTYNPSRKVS